MIGGEAESTEPDPDNMKEQIVRANLHKGRPTYSFFWYRLKRRKENPLGFWFGALSIPLGVLLSLGLALFALFHLILTVTLQPTPWEKT